MAVITFIELLWTISAFLGVVASLYNFTDVLTDMKVLTRSNVNGLRKMLARGNLRTEGTRLFKLTMFLIMGFLVLLNPESNTDVERNIFSWLFIFGLISVNLAMVSNTFADRLLRRRLFAYADRLEEEEERQRSAAIVAETGDRRRKNFGRRKEDREAHHEVDSDTTEG